MKEAVAIARGEMPADSYQVHIPERVDVVSIRRQRAIGNRVNVSLTLPRERT
jgi:hypothetical protein